jgi:ATP-binding cassette subfamily C protein CydD
MKEYGLLRQVPAARAWTILTVAIGLGGTAATIAQMTLLSRIVARVFLGHESLAALGLLPAVLLAAIGLRAVFVGLGDVAAQQGALRVKAKVRRRLAAHLLRLGPVFARGERSGELVATAVDGVERLDAYYSRYLPQVALSVLVPVAILLYVLPLDWISAVLLLVTAPIMPILMIAVGTYSQQHIQRQWSALSHMSAHFLDVLQGLPTLKLLGRGAGERAEVARVSTALAEATLKVLRVAFLSGLALEFMTSVAIGVIAVALGIRLLTGGIGFEQAFVVLLLTPEFYRPLRDLGAHRHAAMEGRAAAERIAAIMQTPAPTGAATRAVLPAHPAGPLTVELAGVGYTYPAAARAALCDVNLRLAAGTRTALVGASGAGKSTLIALLLRFIEPQSGCITVNGMPLASMSPDSWHELAALIPQRPYLFAGTVRENICLARPAATAREVEQATCLAGATEFVERLAQGYDTPIGERGARLSGGQAQRIAIARAFLKDAPLLILDEPTSSLDPLSERLVRQALDRLMVGRTVLVVAHRLNTIYDAHQIAVLVGGRVVQTGRHEELLRRGGAYASLMSGRADVLV